MLEKKVAEHGLDDLRKLAPIGDLGYSNGWYPPFGDGKGIEPRILESFHEQGFEFDSQIHTERGEHYYHCTELGLTYHMDSSG